MGGVFFCSKALYSFYKTFKVRVTAPEDIIKEYHRGIEEKLV
jgi:hypothetical protein